LEIRIEDRTNELKQTLEALEREREILSITLTSIEDAVITTDIQGRITSLNPVAESLTRWRVAEAIGEILDIVFRIVNADSRQTVLSPVVKALEEGVIVGLANHTILISKDGSELPIEDSAAPIRTTEEEIVGCVRVFRDVTERKRMENELRQLASNLSESNHRKDEFFSDLGPRASQPSRGNSQWPGTNEGVGRGGRGR